MGVAGALVQFVDVLGDEGVELPPLLEMSECSVAETMDSLPGSGTDALTLTLAAERCNSASRT